MTQLRKDPLVIGRRLPDAASMLVIDALCRPGLGPVSLTLADGECVAVCGPSGAGKSLLLRAIADLDPNDGRVTLDRVERRSIPAPQWRSRVCYLAAEPAWWADRVEQHFASWDAAAPLAEALLLPADIGSAEIGRLSTGERQRLALIRAIVRKPGVLLLDEPTAALDEASRAAAEALLMAQAVTMLWVTHDRAQAARVASRLLLVEAGRVEEGRP